MRELLNYANGYIRKMNVSDIAMLKVCLCSLGLLAGLAIPKSIKRKRPALQPPLLLSPMRR